MVFSNLFFLFKFLPLNLIIYYLVKGTKVKNIVLLIFSLIFYAWGEPLWIGLLILSTLIDYVHAIYIEKYKDSKYKKYILISDIVLNLVILGVFKYSNFFIENINYILNTNIAIKSIALPIGISFYTFQTISYTIDVYNEKVKAQKDFSKLLMYVSLYPQLIAGPIVRYIDIEREIDNRQVNIDSIYTGINRFIIGLFKKILIANIAGKFVVTYMGSDISSITVMESWFGIFMFTIQIYFDFSGYSDMAIGLGKMFGFNYCENFNYPYISKSATEFWRRWHISLGSFFRDYVYIPLGGNRKRQLINLFIVWFLTGFWHGASWNFIIWGLYFGTLIYIEKKVIFKVLERFPSIISHIYLLLVAMIGWVIFYFTDMSDVIYYLKVMFGLSNNVFTSSALNIVITNNIWWIILCIIASTPIPKLMFNKIVKNKCEKYKGYIYILNGIANALILIVLVCCLVGESYNPFLYYRF